MNTAVAKSGDQERLLQNKVAEMSNSLNESNASTQSIQEQLQQMQRTLMSNEQEKQVLQEKYDNLTSQYNQNKRTIDLQNEKIQGMKQSVNEYEVSYYIEFTNNTPTNIFDYRCSVFCGVTSNKFYVLNLFYLGE